MLTNYIPENLKHPGLIAEDSCTEEIRESKLKHYLLLTLFAISMFKNAGKAFVAQNYCPINLFSVVSKILEKLVICLLFS